MFLRKGNVLGTGGRSVLFFGVYRVDFVRCGHKVARETADE